MTDKPLTAKRQAFCQAYCDNGHNASQAYKTAYPGCKSGQRQNGNRLITNDYVMQEISRIKGEITARSEYDIDQCDKQYSDIITLAINLKQPSAAVSAITGRARLRGWDKDTHVTEDHAQALTPEQAQQFRDQAAAANRARIKSA